MISTLLLLCSVITSSFGIVVDLEDADTLFDHLSQPIQTDPNNQFRFDDLPVIQESMRGQFIFRFRVRSGGDTHVALVSQDGIYIYDIVFGSNQNRYTTIKKCVQLNCIEMAKAVMHDVVSPDEIHNLWIGYDNDEGIIQVGRGVDSTPYLEWRDMSLLPVTGLGISTLHGTQGDWWFPPHALVERCGALRFETDNEYSYRYTLPVIPSSSAKDFEIEFFAEAPADVRIILASEVGLSIDDSAYEIVIGTSTTEQSEIRRCNNAEECCPALATTRTPGILSANELQKFTVRYNNGLLKVFADDDITPFLMARDPSPMSIRAVGYSTGPNNGGVFEFPVQGIAAGILVFETDQWIYNGDLPLVPEENSMNLDMVFLLQASKGARVSLSPDPNIVTYDGPLYEIIIGGDRNRRSFIHSCKQCSDGPQFRHQPLTRNELRPFRVTYLNGEVNVYEQMSRVPFLTLNDGRNLPIRAVGLSTTSRDEKGRWAFFTCNLFS